MKLADEKMERPIFTIYFRPKVRPKIWWIFEGHNIDFYSVTGLLLPHSATNLLEFRGMVTVTIK